MDFLVLGGILFGILYIIFYWCIKEVLKFLKRKKRPITATQFKSVDGHIVKSKGELIIDTYLSLLNIKHEYEDIIAIDGHSLKYDWFLPESNIYMEYWGLNTKEYLKRKTQKIDLYRNGKLKLISIEEEMFSDISSNLRKALGLDSDVEHKAILVKHCPNCGFKLDNRFN